MFPQSSPFLEEERARIPVSFFYGDIFFSEINMTELALFWNVTYLT